MPIGKLDDLIYSEPPRERPFEGGASSQAADSATLFATSLYPELKGWLPLLARLSLPVGQAAYIAALVRKHGTDFQSELLASGLVDEDSFCRALAAELGMQCATALDPRRLLAQDDNAIAFLRRPSRHIPIKIEEKNGSTSYLIAPARQNPADWRLLFDRYPQIARRAKIVAPETLRDALLARTGAALVKAAVSDLFDRYPDFSARIVANAWQGWVCGAGLAALAAALLYAPENTYTVLHIFFSVLFLSCVGLRFAASQALQRHVVTRGFSELEADMPIYSVLVALYKEQDIVPELMVALDRIVWPRARLEIKLVCEEDDLGTLAALGGCDLPRHVEIVRVPVWGPRTKPKALAYALPLASGEFVALYDAEDSPHPLQLIEAWRRFRDAGAELACVQAPLEITNGRAGPLPLMFAFEYAALFRGLLPWLARWRLLVPLGGTSNHFRGLM